MMNKYFLYCLLFCLTIVSLDIRAELWISVDGSKEGECVTTSNIKSNTLLYEANYSVHGFYANSTEINGTTYQRLSFDIPSTLSERGLPALPVINKLFAIPYGTECDVTIKNEKWEKMPIGTIYPSQDVLFESLGKGEFLINNSVYQNDDFTPALIQVGKVKYWKGIVCKSVKICPFVYYPSSNDVLVLKEFILSVKFKQNERMNCLQLDGPKKVFANSNIIKTKDSTKATMSNDNYDYLIIVGDIPNISNCQALSDFLLWKAFKGYKTKMVSTSVTGTSVAQIKQYINNERLKDIKYVLFVGNQDKIPMDSIYDSNLHYGCFICGDYLYGCQGGTDDYYADISIGRFPANTVDELTTMINKTIRYEKFSGLHSYNDVLLIAHQGNNFYPTIDSIANRYHTSQNFTKLHGNQGATNSDVLQHINEGFNIVNYNGHGEEDLWLDWNSLHENFTYNYADSLNADALSIYFSIACKTGNIRNSPTMMRSFLCKNTGAVAFFGATFVSIASANATLNKLLYHYLLDYGIVQIGDLILYSQNENIVNMEGLGIINALMYLCGGDPTLEIWTGITKTFDNYTLSLNGQNLTINNVGVNGFKLSIVAEDGSLIDVVNSVISPYTFSLPSGNFYVVLNKHNYIPRVIYVNVSDNSIQNKVFDNIGIDNYYVKNATISAGYDVTTSVPYGNVSIESGSRVTINKSNGVIIKNGFECKTGGELWIK